MQRDEKFSSGFCTRSDVDYLTSLTEPCWVLATVTCLAIPGPAFGQRADENAVTAAQDAFGTSIGFQNVGLYSANDARGFSPQQAGNLRIEGLYFDQQTWVTGDCMVRETTMRVGIAAQSYSFPAPTGIADLSLRTPGDKALISAILTRGPFDAATADVETQIPLADRTLGVDLCAGYRKNFDVDVFRESHTRGIRHDIPLAPDAEHRDHPVLVVHRGRCAPDRSDRLHGRDPPAAAVSHARSWHTGLDDLGMAPDDLRRGREKRARRSLDARRRPFSFAGARSARLRPVSDVDDESDRRFSDGRRAAVHGRFDLRRTAAVPAIHERRAIGNSCNSRFAAGPSSGSLAAMRSRISVPSR